MAGTEIGRVTAEVRPASSGFGDKSQAGYVTVEFTRRGVCLTTCNPSGQEIGGSYLIKAQAIMLEAALKAAIKEMK